MNDDSDHGKSTMRTIARELVAQRLQLSHATIADLESAARGEIDPDEVVRRIYQRLDTSHKG